MTDLIESITAAVGPDRCLGSMVAKEMYAYDSSPFIHYPDLVVFPVSTEETAEVVRIAARQNVPVTARGAGTCLSGGAVAYSGGVSLVLTKMDRILDIDPINETALVEAGVVNLALQNTLKPYGFMFAPDPASQKASTIGGNVAECAGGIRGVKFGVTKNHLLGLEAVLADGSVVQTGDLAPAEAFGPDPTGLFCGSEGTLGIVTKALVKLTRLPEGVRTGMAVFSSLEDAAAAVSAVIARGIVPTTLEIMDQTMIRAVDDFLNLGFPRDAEALLLIEVDGFEIELDRQMDLIVDVCRSKGAGDVTSAQNPADRDRLWLARRSGNGALGRIKPTAMVQDVTVPRHRLPELLRSVSDIGRKHGVIIAQLAHAGDGNGHPHLLFDPDDADERRRVDEASRDIFQLALDLGGTLTGEHGVGLEKRAFMPMQFSHNDLECMAGLKKALDPHHRLNPGKLLPQEYFNA